MGVVSEKGYSSAQSRALGKAKVPGQHSTREAGCVLSDSLQQSFLERQSCSYLKAAGMRVTVPQVPKGSLRRLYWATAKAESSGGDVGVSSPAGTVPREAAAPGLCWAGHRGVSALPTEDPAWGIGRRCAEDQRQPQGESRNGCHRPGPLCSLQRWL